MKTVDLTEKLIGEIQKRHQVLLERPWERYPAFITCKDVESEKWFCLFMQVSGEKLGLDPMRGYPIVNVKADPEVIPFLHGTEGVLPAYHMSKTHWLTLLLDGTLEEEWVTARIEESYQQITDTPTKRIYEAVKQIPRGSVATYAQIAEMAGNPRMSRAVGNALHNNPNEEEIPCYRVVNARGELSGRFAFGGPEEQKRRLEADGIEVVEDRVDLTRYGIRLGKV